MKVAYVTTYDAADVHAWSGTGTHIYQALRDSGLELETLIQLGRNRVRLALPGDGVELEVSGRGLTDKRPLLYKIKKVLYKALGKNYLRDREPAVLRSYAAQVDEALEVSDCDVVFSPGTLPIAYLKSRKPIVFWTDATFGGLVEFYPLFSGLCGETLRSGHAADRTALQKCRLAIYTSDWAANTAVDIYGADPGKVRVVPFGANIQCDRTADDVRELTARKNFGVCRLLFVGVDWLRKGGDLAVRVAQHLVNCGVPTELHIVGCNPPAGLPSFVKRHGFVSKKTVAGAALLNRLMSESHFLIVPSLAECYGVVFAEASSFGLPSVATNVGGIPAVVTDGRNGQTFPLGANPEAYAAWIAPWLATREAYAKLAVTTFEEYETRLNWSVAGRTVRTLLEEFVTEN